MNNYSIREPLACALTLVLATSIDTPAHAQAACVDTTNIEDTTIQSTYMPGQCWMDLVRPIWFNYALTSPTWLGVGLKDCCNINRPFAKMVSATYLINYALADRQSSQWHATVDYYPESRAIGTVYHENIRNDYLNEDRGSVEATAFTGRILAQDRIGYYCAPFSGSVESGAGGTNTASERATVIVHENWHHWMEDRGFDTSHRTSPTGNCSARKGSDACDYVFPHTIMDYDFGTMAEYQVPRPLKNFFPKRILLHSPYQIAVEYSCDLAESSRDYIASSIRQAARSVSNQRSNVNYINKSAWQCGAPRPF